MAQYSPFAKRAIEQKTGMSFEEYQADKAAKDAGFPNAAAQMQNRIMRNQLEEKATRLGVPLSEAYAKAGSDLTNTQALQSAWNQLTAPAPAAPPPEDPKPPTITDPPPKDPTPTGPSESDLAIKNLGDTITSLTDMFRTQMDTQAAEFNKIRQEQEERMTGLQNMFIAQQQQQDRPTVAGVKTATGSAGDALMKAALRGVSGTFGRRGMRIQSLNV
jgi:hypothetical protein